MNGLREVGSTQDMKNHETVSDNETIVTEEVIEEIEIGIGIGNQG